MLFTRPKLNHKERILREIKYHPGTTPRQLAQITHKFNARISDLRKDGHIIEARRKPNHPGLVYGYHLVEEGQSGDEY